LENDPAMAQMSPVVSAADGCSAFDSARDPAPARPPGARTPPRLVIECLHGGCGDGSRPVQTL
jgi:hypothetical protein